MRTRSSCTRCCWNWRMWRNRSAAYSTSRPSCWSEEPRWKHLALPPTHPRDHAPKTYPAKVSVTLVPTPLGHPRTLGAPAVKGESHTLSRTSPPAVFEIPTWNCFAAFRQTRPNAVIVGDSIVPGILKQDESIGAVVLHAGANDIRLRQTEVLKRDFASLIDTVRGRSPTTKIIISGPLPTYRRGAEKFSRLLALNDWLVSWCNKQNLLFVNWNLFWECPWLFLACTPAASERNCCQTTSPRHYAPSDCIPLLGLRLLLRPTRLHIKP
ncbi:uncharacterized protein LOC128605952 isoform X1 [Ictalurus furcatus]|uniref:uncharacterized protein LOC128605952 isoform X1 n=1 Tax=Ictalurus furcatus TaxID=66913 RepID=UPI002350B647|nr:uncharacterized protein LOC128605952 isoform X1 [Ictalurus furcatus]